MTLDARTQAEQGDLRPQVNAAAPLRTATAAVEPTLLARFFQLARPIADARTAPRPDMRLRDAGQFFYLVETLKQIGSRRMEETLRVLLDDFCQLDERAYDELYLWSIVQLSRTDVRHAGTYWPLALTLDLRYRAQPWRRPAGTGPVDQPYRFSELLAYYYVLYSLAQRTPVFPGNDAGGRLYPSLGSCIEQFATRLGAEQRALLVEVLEGLARWHTLSVPSWERSRHVRQTSRPEYGDALGLLRKRH